MPPLDPNAASVLALAALFARIGGMFLIAPGFSSLRIPMRIRLFMAFGITLALAPPLIEDAAQVMAPNTPADILRVLLGETLIGLFLGLLARLMMFALHFIAIASANFVGLGGIPGFTADGEEPAQAAASLFTITAIVILFIADLHHEIIRAAVGSYSVVAVGGAFDPRTALADLADGAGQTFLVALRLAAPFVIYALIINFAVGLINKLTPQLPVFFVALPAITAGGLILMAVAIREVMIAFQSAFEQLLANL